MDAFKVPSGIPQDLLLIQDLVAELQLPPPAPAKPPVEVDIASSSDGSDSSSDDDDEMDSEDEVMGLITGREGRSSSPERCIPRTLS